MNDMTPVVIIEPAVDSWTKEEVERACAEHVEKHFAVADGRLDMIYRYATKWKLEPDKYATCIIMWEAVYNWIQNDVWGVYKAFKFDNITPDFDAIPPCPHRFFDIRQAEVLADNS